MKDANISFQTLKMIVEMVRPTSIIDRSMPASDYSKGSESAFGMAKDVEFIKYEINEMKATLQGIVDKHVSKIEFNDHLKLDTSAHLAFEKIITDHESRIRVNTTDTTETRTQLKTYGSMLVLVQIGVLIVLHFWK